MLAYPFLVAMLSALIAPAIAVGIFVMLNAS